MKIDNLEDLDKLILLCRKRGLSTLEVDGIKFQLGDPPASNYKKRTGPERTPAQQTLTEDEILFWSSNPHPQVGAVNE